MHQIKVYKCNKYTVILITLHSVEKDYQNWHMTLKTKPTVPPVDMTPFATRMALGHPMEEVWMDIAEVDTTLESTLFYPQATLQGLATI